MSYKQMRDPNESYLPWIIGIAIALYWVLSHGSL